MRQIAGCCAAILLLAGCGGKRSSLLLERHARGPLAESASVAQRVNWRLDPDTHTQEQRNIEVTVTYASPAYQQTFFSDRAVFGAFAGHSPYFLENLVFYVKIANRSEKRILIDPTSFVLSDDRGNQYATINEDYVTALAEARAPMATVTRGLIEEARPGYFGVGIPIGKLFSTKPQGRFALIKQSSLQRGLLYPGVVHDGLVAFWSPTTQAAQIRLLVTNVKTDFDSNDEAQASLEFPFTFRVVTP